jgi:chemotaxis protein methyltransferase CheR
MTFAARMRVLARCVTERMRAGRFRTAREYHRYMEADPAGGREWDRLFALLLNGETRFFRDGPGFAALAGHILPRQAGRPVRAWSAGCSTGQEAYSLAMAGLDAGVDVRVIGTDVSEPALARAATGRYRRFETRGLPAEHERAYFERVGEEVQAGSRLRERVTFRRLDLTATAYDLPPQDVVFCQNVLIYYSPAVRDGVVRKLADAITPGGHLFLGATEAVGVDAPGLRPIRLGEAWVYLRV